MAQQGDLIAGRYRLVERIAEGGMSTVWEAWDDRLHRRVALKRLRPQHGLPEHEARLAVDRTMREARITARLHHVHAVPVYDVVDDDGVPCLVMQYLPSRSLQAVLAERGTLGVTEVARIGSEVASALAAAHQAGIVHRDVKPGNILDRRARLGQDHRLRHLPRARRRHPHVHGHGHRHTRVPRRRRQRAASRPAIQPTCSRSARPCSPLWRARRRSATPTTRSPSCIRSRRETCERRAGARR